MAKKEKRIPVSERAVVARINRKFRAQEHYPRILKKTRGMRAFATLGDWYVLNTEAGGIDEHHVDPEALGREMKVLEDWEYVVEDEGRD
jgi:hypothetical protein